MRPAQLIAVRAVGVCVKRRRCCMAHVPYHSRKAGAQTSNLFKDEATIRAVTEITSTAMKLRSRVNYLHGASPRIQFSERNSWPVWIQRYHDQLYQMRKHGPGLREPPRPPSAPGVGCDGCCVVPASCPKTVTLKARARLAVRNAKLNFRKLVINLPQFGSFFCGFV